MRVSSLNTCLSATLSHCAVLIPQVLLQSTIHDGSQALLIDIVIIEVRTLQKREARENHLCVDLEPEIECGLMTSTLTMTFLFVFSPFLLVFFVSCQMQSHYALAELSQKRVLAHPVLFLWLTLYHPKWFPRALQILIEEMSLYQPKMESSTSGGSNWTGRGSRGNLRGESESEKEREIKWIYTVLVCMYVCMCISMSIYIYII